MVTPTAGVTKSGQLDFGVGFAQGPFRRFNGGSGVRVRFQRQQGKLRGGANCAAFTRSAILFWLEAQGRRCKLERAL